MKELQKLSLSELKDYKELLIVRTDELRRHQVDDDYYPQYTNKEIKELNQLEDKANKALKMVKSLIRQQLDDFISKVE